MFFDIILLSPQHRGHFSQAWLAATRGVKFLPKDKIRETNIVALCRQLAVFITTESRDPKKRFSLRLSAILLSGTLKIYREKVIILLDEVISVCQKVHVPVVIRPLYREEITFETPPTPVAKVKRKRGKKPIVETPVLALAPPEEVVFREEMLQVQEVEDILRIPPATKDLITLREEAPRRTEEPFMEEEEGFGVITGKELEMEMESLFPGRVVERVPPLTPSSEPIPPQVVEVVALVHASRGEYLEEAAKTPEIQVAAKPAEIEAVPIIPMEIAVAEAAEPPPPAAVVAERAAAVEEISVLKEVQPEEVRERARMRVRKPREEVVVEVTRKKPKKEKNKLFLSSKRRAFVRINRCNVGEGQFVEEFDRVPSTFRNANNENLYNMFWFEEAIDSVRAEVRAGSSIRSISLGTPSGLGRVSVPRKRSTLEKDVTAESLRRPPSEIRTPAKEVPLPGLVEVAPPSEERPRPLVMEVPPVPGIPSVVEPELAVTVGEEPTVATTKALEEVSTVPEWPRVTEELFPTREELLPASEELPEVEREKEKRIPRSPPSLDYKLRQQKIIDKMKKWNFSVKMLTIEDLCERPFTKLEMARAFSDLLDLTAKKYLILRSEDDSLELKCIEKGPRFLEA